jgi:hypothetical protein
LDRRSNGGCGESLGVGSIETRCRDGVAPTRRSQARTSSTRFDCFECTTPKQGQSYGDSPDHEGVAANEEGSSALAYCWTLLESHRDGGSTGTSRRTVFKVFGMHLPCPGHKLLEEQAVVYIESVVLCGSLQESDSDVDCCKRLATVVLLIGDCA